MNYVHPNWNEQVGGQDFYTGLDINNKQNRIEEKEIAFSDLLGRGVFRQVLNYKKELNYFHNRSKQG